MPLYRSWPGLARPSTKKKPVDPRVKPGDDGLRRRSNPIGSLSRLFGLALVAGLVVGAVSVAPAQVDQRAFGEPRAEATDADRVIFANGLRQFSRVWDEHDGVGDRFNEHSCVGCHSVPVPGGNFPTMAHIPEWEREFKKPVVTTNQAAFWAVQKRLGGSERCRNLGRLLA